MARHDQRPDPKHMTCQMCLEGVCSSCLDIIRLAYTRDNPICSCRRRGHFGELEKAKEAS